MLISNHDSRARMSEIEIIALPPERWRELKSIRLQSLQDVPQAFGADYADASKEADQYWIDLLQKKDQKIFCAQQNGKLVGLIQLTRQKGVKIQHIGNFHMVYVEPTSQGKGVASALLDAVIAEAKTRGLRKLELEVTASQEAAFKLYASRGFRLVGTYTAEIYAEGKYHDSHAVELLL